MARLHGTQSGSVATVENTENKKVGTPTSVGLSYEPLTHPA